MANSWYALHRAESEALDCSIRKRQQKEVLARKLYTIWQAHQPESLPWEHLHDSDADGWRAVAESVIIMNIEEGEK